MNYYFIKIDKTSLNDLKLINYKLLSKSNCSFFDSFCIDEKVDEVSFINLNSIFSNNENFIDEETLSSYFKDNNKQFYAFNLNDYKDFPLIKKALNLVFDLDIKIFILYANINSKCDSNLKEYIDQEYVSENHFFRFACKPLCCSLNDEIQINRKSFSDYLFSLIDEKKMNEIDVYKNANIDRKLFSKMRNKSYIPSKKTIFALCISLKLNLEESIEFLNVAGYSFSPSRIDDIIVKYYIEHKNYDLFFLNEQLLSYNQSPIS